MTSLINRRCDAVNCTSSYKLDPKIKFFCFPRLPDKTSSLERTKIRYQLWCAFVGGVVKDRAQYLCQYHFPAISFVDPRRTSLVRYSEPLFPFGPLNPQTNDFCPIGEEHLSLSSNGVKRVYCSVDKCSTFSQNMNGLFRFPQRDKEAFNVWAERVGVNWQCFSEEYVKMHYRICPRHFSHHCAVIYSNDSYIRLKFGALPTLHLPCFNELSTEQNSILQFRKTGPAETEALKAASIDSERTCFVYDIIHDECGYQASVVLKRMSREAAELQLRNGSKGNQTDEDSTQARGNGNDECSNKTLARRKNSKDHATETPLECHTFQKLTVTKRKLHGRMKGVTYWSPSDFSNAETFKKKRAESLGKTESLSTRKNCAKKRRIKTARIDRDKEETSITLKQAYEDFSTSIGDVGNEVDIGPPEAPDQILGDCPETQQKKYDSVETALLNIFCSSNTNDDNAFTCFKDSSKIPERDEPNNDHMYCSSSSLNIIRSAAELCEFNEIKIKQLENLIRIDEERVETLENILVKHLSSVLCVTGIDFLKRCFDQVLRDALKSKKDKEECGKLKYQVQKGSKLKMSTTVDNFSADMKKFAVALQTFSGKAYHSMTEIVDLPVPAIARQWATHGDGNPGFSEISFKALRCETTKDGKTVTVGLAMEEVPLKKDVTWDGERLFGYMDFGFGAIDDDHIHEASRALVFFATALNRSWKIPLGYVLGDSLSPQVRANLLTQYIVKLESVGVKCVAVVCNYSYLTYQTFKELGALKEEDSSSTGSFVHPLSRNERIFCFVDIHQLLKAVYNLWVDKKTFQFKKQLIENAFIDRLTSDTSLKELNRDVLSLKSLSKSAPHFSNKLYSTLLTNFRNLGVPLFADTNETTVFLDKLADVTDVFSSRHAFDVNNRKPINKTTLSATTNHLNSIFSYFNNLNFGTGERILSTKRRMPLIFMCLNISSLKAMVKKVLVSEKYQVKQVMTESLHLDKICLTARQIFGDKEYSWTPLEFKKAYSECKESFSLVPSDQLRPRRKIQKKTPKVKIQNFLGFSNTFSYQFSSFSPIIENSQEFFSESVIQNWLQTVQCSDCSDLIQKELQCYSFYDSNSNVIKDIHRMLKSSETILRELVEIPSDYFEGWFDKFANKILNSLNSVAGFKSNDHLFNSSRFGEVTHFTVMVKDILRIFLSLRLCFLGRQEQVQVMEPHKYSS